MGKFAVIRINGKQYLVSEGEEILVDKIVDINNPKYETLLIADSEDVQIGKPVLEKAKITLKVLKELEKGEKIRIFKYKSKSRYRKLRGFRPSYTRLLVEKIG